MPHGCPWSILERSTMTNGQAINRPLQAPVQFGLFFFFFFIPWIISRWDICHDMATGDGHSHSYWMRQAYIIKTFLSLWTVRHFWPIGWNLRAQRNPTLTRKKHWTMDFIELWFMLTFLGFATNKKWSALLLSLCYSLSLFFCILK